MDFFIDNVSATVYLPDGAKHINSACYTGISGSTASNCNYKRENDNTVTFYSEYPLSPMEGFTIATSFTRDVVKRPPPPTKAEIFWENYRQPILIFLFLLILGGDFFVTFKKTRQFVKKKVVIPTFNPPYDWSPATLRFIYKLRSDNKVMTSCILSMAVKGAISIKQENKKYILSKKENAALFSPEEKKVYNILFPSQKDSIALNQKNYNKLSTSNTTLVYFLKKTYNSKDFFEKNIKYKVISILISLAVVFLYAYLCFSPFIILLAFSIPFFIFGLTMINIGIKSKNIILLLFFSCFGSGFLGSGLMAQLSQFNNENILSICFFYTVLIITFLYWRLIGNYTQKGEDARVEIAGFKMYLEATEENRLNLLMPPKQTPELFEKMLPYAVALGVENKWSKKFSSILKEASYQPQWYNDDLRYFSPVRFGKVYSSSSQSPYSSSSSSGSGRSSGGSSWSSGSRGGGSSGGGRGW